MGHEFLSIYPAKAAEYLLAVSYLLLFIPFWRYVQGARRTEVHAGAEAAIPATAHAAVATAAAKPAPAAKKPAPSPAAGWFQVPSDVYLHPGHTWAKLLADGTVAVGLDDLAHRLVAAERTSVPSVGAHVFQGDAAIDLTATGKRVSALSPIDGTVVAVNTNRDDADAYGAGWLFKVKPSRLAANLRQLHQGAEARLLVDDAAAILARRANPEMAQVLQDGGAPVHGIAAALAGDDWDALAREILRS
ncbi:MAG: glycine cleavage system protein H [Anaeromyxobacter sp.]